MMTVQEVGDQLKTEMAKLSFAQLKVFAEKMGVHTHGLDRAEIEDECVALEQYTYTH